jgi:hypothetical protein
LDHDNALERRSYDLTTACAQRKTPLPESAPGEWRRERFAFPFSSPRHQAAARGTSLLVGQFTTGSGALP